MSINIEQLLRLTADYHNFCSDDYAKENKHDTNELTAEELDFVAAAQATPINGLEDSKDDEFTIR